MVLVCSLGWLDERVSGTTGSKRIRLTGPEKLRDAFPQHQDWALLLEEAMARRKLDRETYTSYFYDKLLCKSAGLNANQTFSLIIRTLPERHRASAEASWQSLSSLSNI